MSDDNEIEQKLEVDKQKLRYAVRYQLPIEITTYTLPRNMEYYIREILEAFLIECHQEQMFEYLNFCNGELLTNAKKANTKRVYFKEKNLDITNPDDYEKGMQDFKEETITNIDHYLELQKKEGLYIKLVLHLKGEQIRVEIRNNSVLLPTEMARIQNKLDSVQQYSSMEEVFTKVLDQSEGAGLGIIIIILMLQKIGLSKENYQVIATEEETITRIVLPCNEKIFAGSEILTYEYVKLQNNIPVRKEAFEKVDAIVNAETIDRNALFELAKQDLSIYLLILKAQVKQNPKQIEIPELIQNLSDEQLKELFKKENEDLVVIDPEDLDKNWEHSKNVALFAYNIAKNFDQVQDFLSPEQAYALGLLNNAGTVFLANPSDEQREYVKDLCGEFEDTEKMMDIFFSGNSCPHISMIFLKKIGLADEYSAIIGSWNNINSTVDSLKPAAKLIYLAEALELYDEKVAEFYQFDKEILKDFSIGSEEQFKDILGKLKSVNE